MPGKAKRAPVLRAEPQIIEGEIEQPPTNEVLEGEVQEKGADSLQHAFVEFEGRTIEVQAPELEQIVIIRRLQRVFSDAAKLKNIKAEEALDLMDRALTAIVSVTVHREDAEFIENLWLDRNRKLKLEETLPLLTASMKALEA